MDGWVGKTTTRRRPAREGRDGTGRDGSRTLTHSPAAGVLHLHRRERALRARLKRHRASRAPRADASAVARRSVVVASWSAGQDASCRRPG